MTISLREATTDDAQAIFEVQQASVEKLGSEAYDRECVDAWKAANSDPGCYPIDAKNRWYIVAELDGTIVGFGSLGFPDGLSDSSTEAEITSVYVHPAVARQGIGSQILTTLETAAQARGIESLSLRASLNAVPFYEDHGYESVSERSHEFADGVEGSVVGMRTVL